MNSEFIKYIIKINNKNKILGMYIFGFCVALVSLAIFPVSPFNFLSVYLYPTYIESLFVSYLWHILSALFGFVIIRYYKPKLLINTLDKVPELKELLTNNKISKSDYITLGILTRIAPSFPYGLVNYFWGLSEIPFSTYLISTIIGITPFILVETWIFTNTKLALSHSNSNKSKLLFVIISTILILYLIDIKIKQIVKKINNKKK